MKPQRLARALLALGLHALSCGGAPGASEAGAPPEPSASQTPVHGPVQIAQASPPSSPHAATNAVERALAYDPGDPLGELESADALDRAAGAEPGAAPKGVASKRPAPLGCVALGPAQRVWPNAAAPAIASAGPGFVIAGYTGTDAGEQVFVVRSARGHKPEPVATLELQAPSPKPRKLAPALAARDENDVALAFVDGKGELWIRRLRLGRAGHGAATRIASGLDPRFAPAVVHQQDRTLVAWTTGSTPMRTELAALSSEDAVLSRSDVTPHAMGACAPTFVAGASPPVLISADARNGMSPILRTDLTPNGSAKPSQVATPVSMMSTPAQLAAAANQGATLVAYAGLGAAATSAIGLVTLPPVQGVTRTLVTGTSYGPLHVSAAAMKHAVVFAADAPVSSASRSAPGAKSLREIHVQVARGRALGPVTVLSAPGGASDAAVAHASHGDVAVAYRNDSGVYVAYLSCSDAE